MADADTIQMSIEIGIAEQILVKQYGDSPEAAATYCGPYRWCCMGLASIRLYWCSDQFSRFTSTHAVCGFSLRRTCRGRKSIEPPFVWPLIESEAA